ncbi:MAG: spore cortex-lytic enzyme [Oscillospiraceae bacterium]|nr:spore cortex-lytic enzyme [Oscillospiraceae bacterium]MBR4691450.1 spore cortex-lytic enzyme [Oscillospiraceae bacterium]
MKKAKLTAALAALFLLNVLLISLSQQADAVAYKQGSSGSTVTKIQQKLREAGYYSYTVDGIYGSRTTAAVKRFQKANGLTADGICGEKTLAALGIRVSSASADANNRALLARLISAEARGEPYVGQVAVGAVVLNRVKHPSFPGTIAGVIYQSGAFSCIADGQFDQPVAASAYRAADDALNGWDPTGGAIYYFNPATATSAWIWSRPLILTIGKHRFCA